MPGERKTEQKGVTGGEAGVGNAETVKNEDKESSAGGH